MHESSDRLKRRIEFDLNQLAEQMGSEKAEFQKIKRSMKLDMQAELQKVREYTSHTAEELRRVNDLLDRHHKIVNLLAEDSMLMQMLQEQDLIDRK